MARGDEAAKASVRRARRGASGSQHSVEAQRAAAAYMDRHLRPLMRNFDTVREKLERLNGDRGSDAEKAVRLRWIDPLTSQHEMEADTVTSVSAADFNALVRDVRALNEKLNNVARRLRG